MTYCLVSSRRCGPRELKLITQQREAGLHGLGAAWTIRWWWAARK
jgi:hypothetical protein